MCMCRCVCRFSEMNTEHEILNFFDINGNFLFYYAGKDFIIIVNGFLFVVTIRNIMLLSHVIMSPNYLISNRIKSYDVLVTCYL